MCIFISAYSKCYEITGYQFVWKNNDFWCMKKLTQKLGRFKLGFADLNIITKGYCPKPYKFHDFAHFVSIFARLKLRQYLLDFKIFRCSEKP